MSVLSIKCVTIGDGCVGKTTLLLRLSQQECDNKHEPTVFDNYLVNAEHNGQSFEILLIDTAGQEGYEMLTRSFFDSANIILVCFDVTNTDSFYNVKEKWLREIEVCPSAVKILVGTKSDLRNDPETIDKLNANSKLFVTKTVAKNFAKVHNMKYVECSALTQENVQEVLKAIMEAPRTKGTENGLSNPCCCVHPVLQLAKRVLCCKNNY
ncbi:hypothetical protein Zmor_014284 [Zophobas morio]|uniref:Uncharacterized protein n=1 Tax=Zophobas morio TaxID=2755281 RepID=A0AA38MGE1_9CUCU|nr:hypothetical protein Zmor_014284 [Zophobas morio]